MHSAIFVATPPKDRRAWESYLGYVKPKTENAAGLSRLGENVWLVNLTISVAALGWLVAFAEGDGISYGILPFERAPEWLPAGFDPTSIQVHNEQS